MTIEWRKTAGGVEIAEHEDLTAIAYPCEARVDVFRNCTHIDRSSNLSHETAKQWFEREYCQPKYTVTKYGDGGEVYASEDGKRVAMVTVLCGAWSLDRGDGHCKTGICEYELAKIEAIAYVTGKDS